MDSTPITAERELAAPAETVFEYLEDLANHARLAPRSAQVLKLEHSARAVVLLHGPLGLRRTAATEIVQTDPPTRITGRATLGARTAARVTWTIAATEGGSTVRLETTIESAGRLDALVLRLGGRRWIARRFAAALDSLAQQLASEAPQEASSATARERRAARAAVRPSRPDTAPSPARR
jgi:uncharacterized protein YndB with AHSA1/START domain